MRSRNQILSLLLLLSPTATCSAANFQVHAYDGYFDPDRLAIQVGDTITFDNLSSGGPTNVHAANTFRCAVGCQGDGSGATGNPSKAHWSDTLAFNKPGIVAYVSDRQASDGMVGKIMVSEAEQTGQNIVGGLSGNWYDPAPNPSGHGFQIEIQPDNSILAVWFVFNPAGNAQSWIFSQGSYDPAMDTVTIPAFLETGGAFPPQFDGHKLAVTPGCADLHVHRLRHRRRGLGGKRSGEGGRVRRRGAVSDPPPEPHRRAVMSVMLRHGTMA